MSAVVVILVLLLCLGAVADAARMQRSAEAFAQSARSDRDAALVVQHRAREKRDAAVARASLAELAEAQLAGRLEDSERRREIAVRHARALRIELRAVLARPAAIAPSTAPEVPALVPVRAVAPVQPKRRRRPLYAPDSAIDLTAREVERSTIGPVVRMCARKPWAPVMAHTERGVAPALFLVRRGVG